MLDQGSLQDGEPFLAGTAKAPRAAISPLTAQNLGIVLGDLVTVTADGFEWQGRPYKSLSAIARAITGTRWNGWTFFGLKNHRGRR